MHQILPRERITSYFSNINFYDDGTGMKHWYEYGYVFPNGNVLLMKKYIKYDPGIRLNHHLLAKSFILDCLKDQTQINVVEYLEKELNKKNYKSAFEENEIWSLILLDLGFLSFRNYSKGKNDKSITSGRSHVITKHSVLDSWSEIIALIYPYTSSYDINGVTTSNLFEVLKFIKKNCTNSEWLQFKKEHTEAIVDIILTIKEKL